MQPTTRNTSQKELLLRIRQIEQEMRYDQFLTGTLERNKRSIADIRS